MSTGFFKEQEVKNPAGDAPWKKSERDYVLESFFAGSRGPREVAQKLGRNPKAIKRLLEQFTYNERDRVLQYEPFKRTSRQGKKFTSNEQAVLKAHREKGVPPEATARLLCRKVEEIAGRRGSMGAAEARAATACFAPTLDLIWALRYIYFVYKQSVVTDEVYDALVSEEIEYGGGELAIFKIKSHSGWPDHIKSLALYLVEKDKMEKGKK